MAVNPMSLFVTGSKLYFIASTGGFPPSQPLYYTTGGSSGISVVSGIAPMQGFMADYNGELYLLGDSPVTGPELYKTNGASGSLVKEFYPGSGGTNLAWPCVYKNKLYFSAETAGEGKELWVTDGTAAGTTLVRDIITGTNGSAPMYLTVYKDHLYFAAQDTVGNYQVFRSDGTAAGTKMFQPATATEVSPLSNANGFRGFKEFKGALFYTANYTAAGSELWSLTDTSTPPIGIHTITTQNNDMVIYPNPNKGIFQIQFANTDFSFGTISIYDLMGRRVYSTVLNDHSKNLSVKPLLPAGVYQIRLQLDNTIISKKLLIE
jgi:ELWxxDGT repeat protein